MASTLTYLAAAALLTSCAPASQQSASTSRVTPVSATPSAAPVRCPAARALTSLPTLARLAGDADDIAVTPMGDIWVSEPRAGMLVHLSPAGAVLRTVSDPDAPEGIAVAADGELLVAEQRTNTVSAVDPVSVGRRPLLTVPGATGLDVGIDGIALDVGGTSLLVPDSPQGTLLRAPLGGGAPRVLASGLGRPVSAAPLPDGTILVAEENPPGLVRVAASGGAASVVPGARLRSVDDVVAGEGGFAYVADLAAGAVEAVELATGRLHELVTRVQSPQGVARTPGGRLLLTDSATGAVALADGCG